MLSKLSHKKKFIQQILFQLFNNEYKVNLMAKTFRIFPTYFSIPNLQKFLESKELPEYMKYIQKAKQNSPVENKELKDILKNNLEIKNMKERKVLQSFIDFLYKTENMSKNDLVMEILDLRNPQNWFLRGERKKRKFIYHHGPTNSGKTFHAINELKNLKETEKGIYMAPLRLLAWETQQKLGKCNLITGQEKDFQNSNLTSCTVEAADLSQSYDVAVIDEIQMISEEERGWGWTKAVLGLNSSVIHLCGDERALNLISKLVGLTGDELQEKKYSRLSKLKFIDKDFKYSQLEEGDCVINFAMRKVLKIRQEINNIKKGNKTAVIYGKLPPQCRKNQAYYFNSKALPYLSASNAIGMGLNLNIRKIIFSTLTRMNWDGHVEIKDHEIRQIAGRAGRGYGDGYVQCMQEATRKRVKKALRKVNITVEGINDEQIVQDEKDGEYCEILGRRLSTDQCYLKKAIIFFPFPIIQRIKLEIQNLLNKELTLLQTMKYIKLLSKENKEMFSTSATRKIYQICEKLQKYQLQLQDQFKFCSLPLYQTVNEKNQTTVIKFAEFFQKRGQVFIPKFVKYFSNINSIVILQNYHMIMDGYCWFWNLYQLEFSEIKMAENLKKKICLKISQNLHNNEEIQNENDFDGIKY